MPPSRGAAAKKQDAAAAAVFAALGDATRLRVVRRLGNEGPLSITALTEGASVTRQAVTKHLRVLEEAGLVRSEREGRESVWSLEPSRFADAKSTLDVLSVAWDVTLERLRAFVETPE